MELGLVNPKVMKLLISWHKFGRDLFDSALAALPLLFTNCVSRDDRKGRKSISSALRLWLPHTFSYRFSTGFIFEHQILMMKFYDETFRGRRKKTGRRWVNKHLAQSPHFLLWTSLDIIKIGYSLKYSIKRRREVGRQEFVVLILKRFAFSIIISHFTSSWFWFYFLFFCSLHSKDSPSSKLMFDPFYLDNICIKHNDTTTTTMMHIQEVKKEEKKLHPWGIFALSFSLSFVLHSLSFIMFQFSLEIIRNDGILKQIRHHFYSLFIRWRWHIMHWGGNWSFLNFHHRQWRLWLR